jgi:hypothetical protein
VPPGISGSAVDVVVITPNGSASVSGALHYIPAVQIFPLAGASLLQGIYDAGRGVLYYTDRAAIDVFSLSNASWRPPINLSFVNASSRLVGIALSPDGNTLAVSDSGNANIYVLNPSSPGAAMSFHVNIPPFGLAVTNSGNVYYATVNSNIDPPGGFFKLSTATGTITELDSSPTLRSGDVFMRVLLSADGSRVFANGGGSTAMISTATDLETDAFQADSSSDGNEEMALSRDGTVLLTSDLLTSPDVDVFSAVTYIDRDVWFPVAVFGQKLSSDGRLEYQPLTDGIDIHDGITGLLQYRVQLPVQFPNVYDALVVGDSEGVLFAITSNGIAKIDVSALPLSAASQTHRLAEALSRSDGGTVRTNCRQICSNHATHNIRSVPIARPRLHPSVWSPSWQGKRVAK